MPDGLPQKAQSGVMNTYPVSIFGTGFFLLFLRLLAEGVIIVLALSHNHEHTPRPTEPC